MGLFSFLNKDKNNIKNTMQQLKDQGYGEPVIRAVNNLLYINFNSNKVAVFNLMQNNFTEYDFKQIIACDLSINDNVITEGSGIGRAIVGGALFGGAGAVVGAVTGSKKTKKEINKLELVIVVDDIQNPEIRLPAFTDAVKYKEDDILFNKNFLEPFTKVNAQLNAIARKFKG